MPSRWRCLTRYTWMQPQKHQYLTKVHGMDLQIHKESFYVAWGGTRRQINRRSRQNQRVGGRRSFALKGKLLEALRIYSPDKNDTHVAISYNQEQGGITYALIKALKAALNKGAKPRDILDKFSGSNPAAVAFALSVKDEKGNPVINPNLPIGNALPLVRAARDGQGTNVVYLLLFRADPSLSLKENINTDLGGNSIEISDADPAVKSLLSKSGEGSNVPGLSNITARQFLGDALNQMQLYVKNKEVMLALKKRIEELDRLAEAQDMKEAQNNRAGTDPKETPRGTPRRAPQGVETRRPESRIPPTRCRQSQGRGYR